VKVVEGVLRILGRGHSIKSADGFQADCSVEDLDFLALDGGDTAYMTRATKESLDCDLSSWR